MLEDDPMWRQINCQAEWWEGFASGAFLVAIVAAVAEGIYVLLK